jgi:hypothetical protein
MQKKVAFLANLARDVAAMLTQADPEDVPDIQLDQEDVDEMTAGLRRLEHDRELWSTSSDTFLPHDSDAAILQSSMDEYYRRNESVDMDDDIFGESLTVDPLVSDSLPLRFEEGRTGGRFKLNKRDPRWALVLQAMGIKMRRGPAPFPDNTDRSFALTDKARIVVFADWASGIPNAIQLASEIWNAYLEPEVGMKQLHALHLGDAYYAGLPRDYRKRFTPYWPVPLREEQNVSSWSLPGNHDMYSGGHGFFEMLNSDRRFANQNGSSYFLLENEYWQVFGLDTAFEPPDIKGDIGDMYGEQAAWLAQKRAAAPNKKCLLLTHHQPFSTYASVHEMLERRLRPIRRMDQITGWFWGHEHLCAVYKQYAQIPYPVLLGHSGFPEKPKPLRAGAPPLDFDWSFTDSAGFVIFGFAVLDFDRDKIQVQLVDRLGKERHRFAIS